MGLYLVWQEMESVQQRMSVRKSVSLMAIGLLAFLAYLYFFVGFSEITEILRRVNPLEYFLYYSLTIAAIVLSVLFYAVAWHELLKVLSIRISLKKSFLYSWLGNFVDLVVPLETMSGEVTRAYLVYNDVKDHFGKTVASLVCHRIVSIITTLSMLIFSSLYLILNYPVEPKVLYLLVSVTVGTAATIMALLYLSVRESAARKLVNFLIRLVATVTGRRLSLASLRERAERTLLAFHEGFKTFGKSPGNLVEPLVYSYVSWFLHLSIYFLVFYALGFREVTGYVSQIVVVFSISLAVQTIPIGFPVGLVEIVMTSLYVLFGISPAISGVATSLIRSVTFWFQILVGYAIFQWIGLKQLAHRNGMREEKGMRSGASE